MGVPPQFLDFLNDYLLPREGRVTVEGSISETMELCDMVFQGTVLGPTLWNVFFADIVHHVQQGAHETNLFADDLSISSRYPQNMSNDSVSADLQDAQDRAHEWVGLIETCLMHLKRMRTSYIQDTVEMMNSSCLALLLIPRQAFVLLLTRCCRNVGQRREQS